MSEIDVIDHLVGIAPGSRLDAVRAQRQQARDNAQASYRALFQPDDISQVTLAERYALAVFVAGLHHQTNVAGYYETGLAKHATPAIETALHAEIIAGAGTGPYGHYPKGPLTPEDTTGPTFRVSTASRAALGPRLAAALEHAHMLVFHPRDAAPPHLQSLLDAGWSTTGIVTLSQLVAFLAFQIRVVFGLRALAAA